MQLIVTDLTRFSNNDKVCIAGIDVSNKKKCIRPMPYLKKAKIIKLAIVPGEILEGNFKKIKVSPPHVEDMSYSGLKRRGPCTSEEFEEVLQSTTYSSLCEGFENKIKSGTRLIPFNNPPSRSITTLSLLPHQAEIIKDRWGKIKLHLTDNDSKQYSFMPIADLGFYLRSKDNEGDVYHINSLNQFIQSQKKLYLRVGLSRAWGSSRGDHGFWLQVNGIYTFPNFLPAVRSYPD